MRQSALLLTLLLPLSAEGFNPRGRSIAWGQGPSATVRHMSSSSAEKEHKQAVVSPKRAALEALCDATPDNGVGVSEERLKEIEAAIEALEQDCPAEPAKRPLEGTYDLLFCTAPGGSNGKVGPFVGKVTQEFVDGQRFINAVSLFRGAVKVSLFAERDVIADDRIKVTFKETGVALFGNELFRKELKGSGVWKQRYVDDDLRVMNTPSIFVLKKRRGERS